MGRRAPKHTALPAAREMNVAMGRSAALESKALSDVLSETRSTQSQGAGVWNELERRASPPQSSARTLGCLTFRIV